MDRHKSPSSGCQHVSEHTSCIGPTFCIQILEKHSGTGYINDKRRLMFSIQDYLPTQFEFTGKELLYKIFL